MPKAQNDKQMIHYGKFWKVLYVILSSLMLREIIIIVKKAGKCNLELVKKKVAKRHA